MSDEQTGPGTTQGSPKTSLQKRLVPFEEGNPGEEPLFINYFQVAQAAGSAYIDVGVIPLDDLLSSSGEANFLVLTRLVMSRETIIGLAKQITESFSNEQS
jgi:hypothetical protein